MSRYSVAVCAVHDSKEEMINLLAPYSETDERFFVMMEDSDETVDFYKKRCGDEWRQRLVADGHKFKDGKWWFARNPNAKWDLCTLNGRNAMFELERSHVKHDGTFHQLRDYKIGKSLSKSALREATTCYRRLVREGDGILNEKYYLERYPDVQSYIRSEQLWLNTPNAYISPDGEWHSPGNVGFFGFDDSTREGYETYAKEWLAFVKENQELYVSFTDCHI